MNVLLAYSAEQTGDELHPNLRPSGTYNDGVQDWWLYLCTEILTADRVIGAWNPDGTVLVTATDQDGNPTAYYPIHPDYEAYIRPFGNDEGEATDKLDYHHWAGGGQRYLQDVPAVDTAPEYPADEQPIVLTMESRYDDTAGFEGYGWIATIEFSDPSRPPDARAIGIYDSGWNYLYTTGAFVWTDTGEVDGEGNPVFKWQTVNPAGRVTTQPEPIYYALLLGSAQEGRMVLETDSRTDFFWEHDQGAPAGAVWVDSGVTVTGMAGTATSVSDTAPFVTGQPVRIDGVEFSITSIGGGWLALDPYAISPTGAAVEVLGTVARVTHGTFPVTHDGEPVTHD